VLRPDYPIVTERLTLRPLVPADAAALHANEASHAMLRLGFDQLGLHRIIARVDARNGASCAVLRRLGMRHEAHLVENEWFKGEWTDEVDYAMLAAEWRGALRAAD
jgi:RimJ/RimL family protein N-acetyltransferase